MALYRSRGMSALFLDFTGRSSSGSADTSADTSTQPLSQLPHLDPGLPEHCVKPGAFHSERGHHLLRIASEAEVQIGQILLLQRPVETGELVILEKRSIEKRVHFAPKVPFDVLSMDGGPRRILDEASEEGVCVMAR
jgi:hypothetical protein